jgi:sortase B
MHVHRRKIYKFLWKRKMIKSLGIICILGFLVFIGLLVNEVFIQPYRTQKAQDKTYALYHDSNSANHSLLVTQPAKKKANAARVPGRDKKGRLLKFASLLKKNEEVKGWLTIPGTNINYVVMQPQKENRDYYLTRNMFREYDKAGSLFIDPHGSLERKDKNIVIHGHNMASTQNMFHSLVNYKSLDFYKKRPVFTFDSIYETGKWKIISIFITNGTSKKEKLFNYTKSEFLNASDFLNFIYQLKIRSMLNINSVDINVHDRIMCLSTCSYEINNYRTVVVARKVRKGEDPSVDVSGVTVNQTPLYPSTFYAQYGGHPPALEDTFEKALQNNEITWYRKLTKKTNLKSKKRFFR